jgi:hypothetical protein
MEPVRRCKECRRIVKGHAGDACPYCGSPELLTIVQHSTSEAQHHPSIVAAALTFCAGSIALRLIANLAGGRIGSVILIEDLVANLQMLVTCATLLYLLLRRAEGDFRALFVVSFALFCCAEGVSTMARTYGLYTLDPVIMVFNIAIFMYSSLTVTASLADGPQGDTYKKVLVGASLGFMLLATLRTFLGLRGANFDRRQELIIVGVLAIILIYMLTLLLVSERAAVRRSVASESASLHSVPPEPPASPEA